MQLHAPPALAKRVISGFEAMLTGPMVAYSEPAEAGVWCDDRAQQPG
jgi:hypothetical protein